MSHAPNFDHGFLFGGLQTRLSAGPQTHFLSSQKAVPQDVINVPDPELVFHGTFKRSGLDLILSRGDREFVLHDYFKGDKHAALRSPDGAYLTGEIVSALTGTFELVQAGAAGSGNPIIGHVSRLSGSVTAIRGGVSITLSAGDDVEKGDVVSTGSDSTLGIIFIDGTVFGLSSNARMVLNDMVYDPNGSNNSSLLSLIAGTVTFVAGETAKHGDMKVDTPVATMGIRGTAVVTEISFFIPAVTVDNPQPQPQPQASFQVLVEPDGTTGSYILFDKVTLLPIATVNQAGQMIQISGGNVSVTNGLLSPELQKLITDVFSQKFTGAPQEFTHFTDIGVLPTLLPIQLASQNTTNLVNPVFHPDSSGGGAIQLNVASDPEPFLKVIEIHSVVDKASFTIAEQVRITDTNPTESVTPYVPGTAALLSVTGPSVGPAGPDLTKLITVDPATGAISYNPADFTFLAVNQNIIFTIGFDSRVGPDVLHETLTVTIDGVGPAFEGKAAISANEEGTVTLGARVEGAVSVTITGLAHDLNGFSGGSYDASTGTWRGTAAEFNALTFVAGEDGAQNLVITATGAQAGSATENYKLTVAPILESPSFGGNTATSAGEGGVVTLGATVATHDADDGAVSVKVTGLAHDLSNFNGGNYDAGSGSWSGTASEFNALTFVAGEDGTQNLLITATTTGAETGSATENYKLTIAAVQESPSFGGSTTASADEKSVVTLGATVAAHDADDGAVSVRVTGLAHDLNGFSGGSYDASTGTWSGTAAEFNALTFLAGEDGSQDLVITATTKGAEAGSASTNYKLTIAPVQESPSFGGNTAVSANEESVVTLGATVAADDADDSAVSVKITGLAHDLSNFNGGNYDAGSGSWSGTASEFNALTFVAGEDGTQNLLITATTTGSEAGSATESYTLSVAPVQEVPSFGGNTAASANEESVVTLGATVAAHDADDSAVSVKIAGLAHDLSNFNGGNYDAGSGSWSGTASEFNALTFVAGEDGTQNLLITATTTGAEAGSATESYMLTIASAPETPVFGGNTALSADEFSVVTLGVTVVAHDADGGPISVTITGLARDLSNFSGGSYDAGTGTWTGTASEFNALTFVAGEDEFQDLVITATTTGPEAGSVAEEYMLTTREAPTPIFGMATGAVTEDGILTTGGVLSYDTEIGVNQFQAPASLLGTYGTFAFDIRTGVWSYTLNNAAANVQSLAAGQVVHDTLTVISSDGDASKVIDVSITGTDGAPAGVSGGPINLGLTEGLLGFDQATVTISNVPDDWIISGGVQNGDGSWTIQAASLASLTVTTPALFAGAALLAVTEKLVQADGTTTTHFISDNIEAYSPGSPIFAWSGDDFLTASANDDLLVFAQPIHRDTVYKFDPSADRIDLIGFDGFADFSAVQRHLADDVYGDATISLTNGQSITLQGVHTATLSANNFVFDQTPASSNLGVMTIADGAFLPLSGEMKNSGTIALSARSDGTDLQIIQRGLTLEGGGQILLSDSDANIITGTCDSVTLNNQGNTIGGAGQLGNGELKLINAGLIEATGTHALVIDTGSNNVTNSGVLEASGIGGLTIRSGVTNSGTLWANGANLLVEGELSGGGVALIDGPGVLDFEASSVANVIFGSRDGGTLKLGDSLHFGGNISGFGGDDRIDLADLSFDKASVSYFENHAGAGGALLISDGSQAVELSLLGNYSAGDFSIAPDHGKGTLIYFVSHDLVG